MKKLSPGEVKKFRKTVYDYYRSRGRHAMPWRRRITPYRVLVSEIMLQQTQVERVTVKFAPFMARFPTIASLAMASTRSLLCAWQGLGYNRRALALQKTCRMVVSEYGGRLPSDPERLGALPGIGPATAASIAAFAFNRPAPFLETNIRCVYIHTFFPGAGAVSDDDIMPLVEQTLDGRQPRRWYYALMDYGAALKKQHPNPNRRSLHYTRQSRFAGSDRQVRGELLRLLLGRHGMTLGKLGSSLACEPRRLERIVHRLVSEGLITRVRKKDVRHDPVYAII